MRWCIYSLMLDWSIIICHWNCKSKDITSKNPTSSIEYPSFSQPQMYWRWQVNYWDRCWQNLNVAKVRGLQSTGVKGEVVVVYRESLTTKDLKSSGFPEGSTTWQKRPHPLNSQNGYPQNGVIIVIAGIIPDHLILFAMLFMQRWGLLGLLSYFYQPFYQPT